MLAQALQTTNNSEQQHKHNHTRSQHKHNQHTENATRPAIMLNQSERNLVALALCWRMSEKQKFRRRSNRSENKRTQRKIIKKTHKIEALLMPASYVCCVWLFAEQQKPVAPTRVKSKFLQKIKLKCKHTSFSQQFLCPTHRLRLNNAQSRQFVVFACKLLLCRRSRSFFVL